MVDARPKCDCPPHAISPSQIDTYRKCPRRWGFRKLSDRPEAETTSQKAGKEIHARLEAYALTGKLPDLATDKYAKPVWAVIGHLPTPNPAHACEQHVRYDAGDVVLHGYPDLLPHGLNMVVDYKTVSVRQKPFEFALTPLRLMADTQATLYAHSVRSHAEVLLKWLYIERAPPYRVHLVEAGVTREFINERLASVVATAKEMLAHRAHTSTLSGSAAIDDYVNQMPANTGHCDAYGGCPHAKVCTAYAAPAFFNGAGNKMAGNDMQSVLAKVRARHAQSQGAEPMAAEHNPDDKVTAQAPQASDPPAINPPVEDLGEDDTQVQLARQIAKLQAEQAEAAKKAEEAKKQAAEAAKKAEATAAKQAKAEAAKSKPQTQAPTPVGASQHASVPVATSLDRSMSGFSLSITAQGKSLAECIKTAQQYIADLAGG